MEDGEIRGAIADAQGRLNINALGYAVESSPEYARLAALFAQRGAPSGALATIGDWIDQDGAVRDSGAEDAYYLAGAVPHLAGNSPMLRVAELSFVKGMTSRALSAVLPFLSALPTGTPVNVNTAPPEVLAAIANNLVGERLEAFIADRARKPFTTVAEFRRDCRRHDARKRFRTSVGSLLLRDHRARQGATRSARALVRRGGGAESAIVWQIVGDRA